MKIRFLSICALLLLSSLPVFSQVPGTKLWDVTITTETFEPTPASSPALGPDGTIYVGSTDPGGKGRLYAINPNGTTNWTCKTGGEIRSAPAIGPDGQIYFGSLDGVIWSLNPDGTTNWTVNTGMQVRSSPAIALDGTIYIGYGSTNINNLLALSPNGTTNWIFTMGGVPSYSPSSFQFSSPSIGPDGTIYVGSLDKRLYAINPDGSTNWVFFVGANIFSCPTIGADGTIYVGADSGLWAITPRGARRWFSIVGTVESTVAIGLTNSLYFGVINGPFSCLDASGKIRTVLPVPGSVSSSPAIASDGTVYIAPYLANPSLYAVSRYNTNKWVSTVLAGNAFSSPVIAPNGTIYLVAGHQLYAFYETNPPLNSASPMFRRHADHNARALQAAVKNISHLDDGSIKMDLHVEPNASYRVQATTNFVNWDDLTNFLSTGLSSQFIDDTVTNFSSRYYRLTSP